MNQLIELLAKERPVGTKANTEMVAMVEKHLNAMGYSIQSLPFDCMVWNRGASALETGNQRFVIEPSPFSEPFNGSGKLNMVKTTGQLQSIDCKDTILLLAGEITQSPLQPKDYPFYYPDEHKEIISLLEKKQPKAIIAVTGKNALNGQNPFPLIEDGNFSVPSASISERHLRQMEALTNLDTSAGLVIDSHKTEAKSRQLVASKKANKSAGKIILGAHMDTKYNTPGALDNAAGVAVLLEAAQALNSSVYDIDIVPFNSEEFYGANGEQEYLKLIDSGRKKIVLMVNVDSPCHRGSETAVSFYNFNPAIGGLTDGVMAGSSGIVKGKKWYAGDHVPFILRGIPCMAVTSSDFFDGALERIHTPQDTVDTVDFDMIKNTAQYIVGVVSSLNGR